jgi:membrane-associated phospholipid phosphatase
MGDTVLAPDLETVPRDVSSSVSFDTVRRSELVILAFLLYAQALAFILPVSLAMRYRVCLLNSAVIVAFGLLIRLDSARPTLSIGVIRDWLPIALVLLAYREMGWFALPHAGSPLESHWVVWDRLVLRGGGKVAIEACGPVLPSILEIAYTLVYALAPFSIAVLYVYRCRHSVDRFACIFALGVLLCYVQFPFWPSEPPRLVFFGQDFPSYDTVFRRFNWWMLGHYGIHTSVFPSAHVAGAFSAAFGMRRVMPAHQWVSRFLFVVATLIAIATVYGRYHYLADVAAGLLMARLAVALQGQTAPGFSRRN